MPGRRTASASASCPAYRSPDGSPHESITRDIADGLLGARAPSAQVALAWLLAQGDDILPPITPYFVMKVGHVPLVPYLRPGAPEAGDAVAALIARYAAQATPLRAVMLARLGPNVWHDTPAQAMAVLEELEETAKLWLLAREKPLALAQAQLQELEAAFGCRW